MFVLGLFSGLAKMYDTPATTTQTKFKDKGDDHDEFVVRWGNAMKA